MTNVNNTTSWGPAYITAQDQELSKEQVSIGYGLPDKSTTNSFGIVQNRRTFRSFIRNLVQRLSNDPLFKAVTFTEDFPESLTQAPRVCWSLVSRRAGINGQTHKGPQLMESWPLEDGSIIEKWIQPQSFDFSFVIFDPTSEGADNLSEEVENWIIRNSHLVGSCGATSVFFLSEGAPELYQNNDSQPLRKRTLYYTGTINYVYPIVIEAIKTIKVWNTSVPGLQVQTSAIVRANNAPPQAYDALSLSNAIVFAVHNEPNNVVNDYYPNIDFNIIIEKQKVANRIFLHWLPQGKRPNVGDTYYITFFLPEASRNTAGTILTEDSVVELGTPSQPSRKNIGRYFRPARTPRVLGQEVDAEDPQKNRTIVFYNEDNTGLLQIVGPSRSYVEALGKASVDSVSLLDLTDIPPANFKHITDVGVV